jgi:hypothetical protein
VETTHTNISHLNPLFFAQTPLGNALSFTSATQCSRLRFEIVCQSSMPGLLFTSSRSYISSKLKYFKFLSQSRLPFVRTRLDAIAACDSHDTCQGGSYAAAEGEKSDDCTMLLSPSLFSAAPSTFSRSNRSSLSMSTIASNPPSFASSRDASDNEADTSVAKSESHLLKTCLIIDGKPNSLSLDSYFFLASRCTQYCAFTTPQTC